MFRAPLCPSSGTHDDSVGYHIDGLVLVFLLVGGYVQAGGWVSGPKAVTAFSPDTHPACT